MSATELWFSHPQVRGGSPLSVRTRPDMINWGYSLTVAKWPTYAGEVVQILAVGIEDLRIQGTVRTYAELEDIYSYFIEYIEIASQGRGPSPTKKVSSYNQQPMLFTYPHRNWTFNIQPRGLPGYRKGRDVIAPEWQIQAFVVDDDTDAGEEIGNLVKDHITLDGAVDTNFALTGQIVTDRPAGGFNPFSAPFPDKKEEFDPTKTEKLWKEYGDQFSKIIPAWMTGDFSSLKLETSKPGFLDWGKPPGGSGQTLPTDATGGTTLPTDSSGSH